VSSAARKRVVRKQRVDQGLCARCGKKKEKGDTRYFCVVCRQYQKESDKRRRLQRYADQRYRVANQTPEQRKARLKESNRISKIRIARLKSQGLCQYCGKRPGHEGKTLCEVCNERKKDQRCLKRLYKKTKTPPPSPVNTPPTSIII